MKYVRQLDGFRAIAVLLVVVSHFSPSLKGTWVANLELARMGVLSFFVLSGFLITTILLDYRTGIARGELSVLEGLRLFIVRRTLRIFPLYYGVLILFAFVLGVDRIRENLTWHLTYTSNFGMAFSGKNFGIANHFWSLCVEEQFYLVWPLVILLTTSQDALNKIIKWTLIVSLTASFCWFYLAGPNVFGDAITLGGPSFALVAGAMLALHLHSGGVRRTLFRLDQPRYVLFVGLALFGAISLVAHKVTGKFELFVRDASWPLMCVWVVYHAVQGRLKFLALGPLVWLGRISYGVYVYHLLLTIFFPQLFSRLGLPMNDHSLVTLLVKVAFVVLVAAASFHFFEQPILKLKDRVSYRSRSARGSAAV